MKKNFHTVRGYENINLNRKLLTPAMEDYLEMIYRCSEKAEFVRLKNISNMLNVKDSSASKMMQKLKGLGLIEYEKYGVIILTEQGKRIGNYLLLRHKIIDNFLEKLGGGEEILIETELIEHVIGSDTVEKIYILNKFFEENLEILDQFKKFEKDKNNRLEY